jgi:hypothetical protein
MLYLHIGTPKAGSSTIQEFLYNYETDLPHKQLSSFGGKDSWKISAALGSSKAYWYFVKHRKILNPEELAFLQYTLWKEVEDELSRFDHNNFVASSEFLFVLLAGEVDAINSLRDKISHLFGDVRIVIYLRNQVDYVKSVYSQLVKGPTKYTLPFSYFLKNLNESEVARNYAAIHYADIIKKWEEAFGQDKIRPIVFHKDNFINKSLIQDFCVQTDVKFDHSWGANTHNIANKSPGFSQIEALRISNSIGFSSGNLRKYSARILRALNSHNGFPVDFDEEILKLVSSGNKDLNEKYFKTSNVRLPQI